MSFLKGVFRPKRPDLSKVTEKHYQDPTLAWRILEKSQEATDVEPVDPSTPKPPNHTRFVCISDTHSLKDFKHPIPEGDVLIHAGDFTMIGKAKEVSRFNEFITSLPHPHKVVIAGNHDLPFDIDGYEAHYSYWRASLCCPYQDAREIKSLLDTTKCTYLEDAEVTINGIRIYGSPWSPAFGAWGFMLNRGKEIQDKWDKIPDDTDVLITHGPPLGYGDLCYSQLRAGCLNLLHTVKTRVKPKYHIFGHIHEGYGVSTDGVTTYINASTATLRYRLENKPVVFDLPNKGSQTSSI